MHRAVTDALFALIVVAIPTILVGNALWLLLNPWFVEVQYALPGFPDDPHGLRGEHRIELAATGVRSVHPSGDGIGLLHEARLPSGDPAFHPREIRHMEDVRGVVAGVFAAWIVALAVLVAGGMVLRRLDPGLFGTAIGGGALVTVAAMALAGVVMLVAFEAFFSGFHAIFFEGRSWRFNDAFTLRRLYPDAFWGIAAGALAALVVVQAVALRLAFRAR